MVVDFERFWAWLSVAGEVSRLTSCPFHCSPSCLSWALLGVCVGFILGLVTVGSLVCLWTFRFELLRTAFQVPQSASRPRLSRYLE